MKLQQHRRHRKQKRICECVCFSVRQLYMVDNIVYGELQLWLALSSTGDNRLIEIEDTARVPDRSLLLE